MDDEYKDWQMDGKKKEKETNINKHD